MAKRRKLTAPEVRELSEAAVFALGDAMIRAIERSDHRTWAAVRLGLRAIEALSADFELRHGLGSGDPLHEPPAN